MKIDSDLRIAIRSVTDSQKRQSSDYAAKRKQQSAAIADLIKRRKLGTKLAQARRKNARAKQLSNEAADFFNSLGVSERLDSIYDAAQFTRAGGKLDKVITSPVRFETVMAQIASATPTKGATILKKLGINWKSA